MKGQQQVNFDRIAQAIEYIKENFQKQPDLEAIAGHVHLSPFHFQRLFTDWAGTTPKRFLQYLSIEHAKKLLKVQQASLADAAWETGLSGTGRLHDLFINIEGMTPAEFKNGGKELGIQYEFYESRFGPLIVAATAKGVCYMSFIENETRGLQGLKTHFPNAAFQQKAGPLHRQALAVFHADWDELHEVKLHLKGTAFQLKVWEALLKVPMGKLVTYGDIAGIIGKEKAARAVGMAVGSNPVAFLIPCHRVIQATGKIGGYMWGTTRKTAIIGWESARTDPM